MSRLVLVARKVALIALVVVLGGCAGTRTLEPAPTAVEPRGTAAVPRTDHSPDAVRRTIARTATEMVGVPYRYGGTSPKEGFDCSGLVFYSYARAGLSVPRNSIELFKAAEKIPLDAAREGDLVFFQDQRRLSHVGIYLGDGRFVHAPSSGDTVRVSTLDSAYYRRHLVGVGRLIGT